MKYFFILASLFISQGAAAAEGQYKIVVFTDEGAEARANEYKTYLKSKPPFSEMGDKLNIAVIKLTQDEMDCNKSPTLDRIVTCNESALIRKQSAEGGQLAVAFTSKVTGGGSGGTIPVATKDYPIETMLHEMLHYYGINDEYVYESQAHIDAYCGVSQRSSWPNSAYFNQAPPYADEAGARAKHAPDVSWMGGIPSSNPILNGGSLGSKPVHAAKGMQVLGLYKGGTCEKVVETWRPYNNSIMRSIGYGTDDTIYPYYADIIRKKIESATQGNKIAKASPPPHLNCDHSHGHETVLELNKDVKSAVKKIK